MNTELEKWEELNISALGMCGCGMPAQTYNFLRDILNCFKPSSESGDLDGNRDRKVEEIVSQNPKLAAHAILHWLNGRDLLEHGSSVGGSWLTAAGAEILENPAPEEEI